MVQKHQKRIVTVCNNFNFLLCSGLKKTISKKTFCRDIACCSPTLGPFLAENFCDRVICNTGRFHCVVFRRTPDVEPYVVMVGASLVLDVSLVSISSCILRINVNASPSPHSAQVADRHSHTARSEWIFLVCRGQGLRLFRFYVLGCHPRLPPRSLRSPHPWGRRPQDRCPPPYPCATSCDRFNPFEWTLRRAVPIGKG